MTNSFDADRARSADAASAAWRAPASAMRLIPYAVLIVAAVVTYQRALSAYFFDDDFQWLVGSWSFAPANLVAFREMTHFYRPVIDVYFALMTPLLGGSPLLFHAASIALHAANGAVLFALGRRMSGSTLYGFAAALFFVVQPGGVDAVAWVGALAEAIGALFGCLSLLLFLRWRATSGEGWRVGSCLAFLLALLTHESSVMFVPVLLLADWAFSAESRAVDGRRHPPVSWWVLGHAPYWLLAAVYLAIDLAINSRNYVVREGHYTVGWHIVSNAFAYLVALYVGRRDMVNYVMLTVVLLALVLRGSRRVQFATAWMLLALAPFLAFNWSGTSRYLYQPAIGFSLLLAEAILLVARMLTTRMPFAWRTAIVGIAVTALAFRSMTFARHNIEGFAERTEVYRRHGEATRLAHGPLPPHTVIAAGPEMKADLLYPFANAMVQWVYRDPTVQLEPY